MKSSLYKMSINHPSVTASGIFWRKRLSKEDFLSTQTTTTTTTQQQRYYEQQQTSTNIYLSPTEQELRSLSSFESTHVQSTKSWLLLLSQYVGALVPRSSSIEEFFHQHSKEVNQPPPIKQNQPSKTNQLFCSCLSQYITFWVFRQRRSLFSSCASRTLEFID